MDLNELEERVDWEELRAELGAQLERRAGEAGLDATSLAQKMGYTPRHIRQVFAGRWRSIGRYEHVARTLSWSVEGALPELDITPPRAATPAAEAPEAPDPDPASPPGPPRETSREDLEAPAMPTPGVFADHRERVAAELKARVEASEHTQAGLARMLGVSPYTLSSVVTGRAKRRDHYDALAGALGLELSEDFTLVALSQDAAESVPAPDAGPSPVTHGSIEDDLGVDDVGGPVTTPTAPAEGALLEGEGEGARERSGRAAACSRLELDENTAALVEWSAMQRGMDPRVWLTLAVAAYHERYANGRRK
jgi:plasmid maintenance system antidote protein VapI